MLIYSGLLDWKDKQHALNSLRGKKLGLRIPNTATHSKDVKLEKPPVKCTRVDIVLDSDQGISDCLLVGDHSSDSRGNKSVIPQIQQHEQLARELQNQVDQKELLPVTFNNTCSVVKAIEDKVASSVLLLYWYRRTRRKGSTIDLTHETISQTNEIRC